MTDFIKGWIVGTVFTAIGVGIAAFAGGAVEQPGAPTAAERVADFNAAVMAELAGGEGR